MATPHVLVLAGGISHERDVSLRSGRRVADSLAEHGLTVELRDPDASLLSYLRTNRPDVVWPALHGASGEDGARRGLLDFSGVPLLDESGASAVQDLWRGLHLREQMLLLVGMSQQARDVSQRVGLTHLIGEAHLHPTRASAERDLQQRLARHPQRPASSA